MESVSIEELLLALKIGFLVLLYLFIWRIVRTASRDIRVPQESFVLAPSAGHGQSAAPRPAHGRLVVVKSASLTPGQEHVLDSHPLTIGRAAQNDIQLRGDGFASARHAEFAPSADGVWLKDFGSTNGTFVNGSRLERPRKLTSGDIVRVGETHLRYER